MNRDIDIAQLIESGGKRSFLAILLLLISIVAFLEGFDAQIQGYTAPTLMKLWKVDHAEFSQVFAAFQFGVLLGAIGLGGLGDIVGRRCLVLYVFMFGILTILGGFATNVVFLDLTRFFSGLFIGGGIPNAIALLVDYSKRGKRAMNVGIMFVCYTVGGSMAGFVAARIVPAFGWYSIYWFCGSAAVLASLILFFALPESLRLLVAKQRDHRIISAALLRFDPALELPPDARFFLTRQPKVKAWVGELFKDGRACLTSALWGAYICNMVALHFATSWLPTILTSGGASYEISVIATGLFQLGGAAGSVIGGYFLDKPNGIRRLSVICLVGAPIMFGIGVAIGLVPVQIALAAGAGFCIVAAQTGINSLAAMLYPTALRATSTGWGNGVARVGAIGGPVIGGFLLNLHLPFWQIFLVAGCPLIVVSVMLRLLARLGTIRADHDVAIAGAGDDMAQRFR